MSNQKSTTASRPAAWVRKGGMSAPWLHALAAFVVGAVFGIFLRNIGLGALFSGGLMYAAVAVAVIVAAIGFAALGRIFTRRRSGWLLAITIFIWAPAVFGTAFIVFSGNGQFQQFNPLPAVAGGVAAAVCALISHGGPPRLIGIIALIGSIVAVATIVLASS
jgi:hypothetical protein